jgi:hypothetical protein
LNEIKQKGNEWSQYDMEECRLWWKLFRI